VVKIADGLMFISPAMCAAAFESLAWRLVHPEEVAASKGPWTSAAERLWVEFSMWLTAQMRLRVTVYARPLGGAA